MTRIVVANIIILVASLLMVYVGYLKEKKKILYVQLIELCLMVIGGILLNAITGIIINFLECIRNILCYKGKLNNLVKFLIILISSILTLLYNNLGFIGLLPLFGTILNLLIMNTNNIIKLKLIMAVSMIMWAIYDAYTKAYTGAFFDFMFVVVDVVAIIQIYKRKGKKKKWMLE